VTSDDPEPDATRRRRTDLLTHLTETSVDADYARAAATRADGASRRVSLVVPTVVLAVLGLLVSLSLVQNRDSASIERAERAELIEQIGEARADVDATNDEIERLRDDIARIQGTNEDLSLRGESLLDEVERARVLVGKGSVRGSGLRITVDDAKDSVEGGTVLDSDLQELTNGLWQAGAEAVAINGNRLGPTTAIRTAGNSVNVNFRALTPPYVVTAVGDPETLPARFSETRAGQSWADLETNYGIRFDAETDTALVLPGAPAGRLRLGHAQRREDAP
jgi:uncharacterized protein YlxW (UPF0749 family)